MNLVHFSKNSWSAISIVLCSGCLMVGFCANEIHHLKNDQEIIQNNLSASREAGQTDVSLQELLAHLKNDDPIVRERAVVELGNIEIDPDQIIPALISLFNDPDPYVQGKACGALGNLGAVCVPLLKTALQDTSVNMRWCAAISLGKIGKEASAAVDALRAILYDTNENVRWCGIMALAQIGPDARDAVGDIKKCRYDRDEDVRWASDFALNAIDPSLKNIRPDLSQVISLIETLTPHLMDELHVPGVSVAVVSSCKIAWSNSFGIADIRTGDPVKRETVFEAASMSKPIFAYAFLKLAESGRVSLDEPIIRYLKEPANPDQAERKLITARMILSHAAGFPNWRKGEEERDGPLPILFKPGSLFGYSGEGIFLLQRAMEQVINESLDSYARTALFDPLQMKNTEFAWSERLDVHLAAGHDTEGRYLQKTKYRHANAAYTLYTTAEDYAKFIIEIMKQDRSASYSLSKSSIEKMLSHVTPTETRLPVERPGLARGKEVWWGLGWSINTTSDGDIIHHSGSNRSGFRSFAQFNPNRQTGIVIMTNGSAGTELWVRLISAMGDF